jgi:hypothetical protein
VTAVRHHGDCATVGRKPQELEHVRIADERARSLIDATGLRQREYGVTLGG